MLISCTSPSEILRDFWYVVGHVWQYQKHLKSFVLQLFLGQTIKWLYYILGTSSGLPAHSNNILKICIGAHKIIQYELGCEHLCRFRQQDFKNTTSGACWTCKSWWVSSSSPQNFVYVGLHSSPTWFVLGGCT